MRIPLSILCLLSLPAILPGCILLEDGRLSGPHSRMDCSREGRRPVREHAGGDVWGRNDPDTVLLFSAVRFPDDYDWQRDTAYGSVPFELLLYRDFEPVLTLQYGPEACFSPDPARHHLLSGHLYTERAADGQTRIGRDGTELFRFAGRELLVGLQEDGDDLYTLSQPGADGGFTFRRNGTLLLERPDGVPFGSLADPSCGPTGALRRDGGQVVFCYRSGRSLFVVRDGQQAGLEPPRSGAPVLDIKVVDGKPVILQSPFRRSTLSEGRIWPEGTSYAVTGRFVDFAGNTACSYLDAAGSLIEQILCREEAIAYHSPEATFAIAARADGSLAWYGPDGSGLEPGPVLFPSPSCALAAGSRLLLAFTPKDKRRHPLVRYGRREIEVDLHGYISSVGVLVSQPAS